MPPVELLQLLRRRPFAPFVIHMSDGVNYTIRHPELLMVGVGSATVGFPSADDPVLYDRTEIISLRHVVRVEPLEPATAPPSPQSN
jgi:hypothetical protein